LVTLKIRRSPAAALQTAVVALERAIAEDTVRHELSFARGFTVGLKPQCRFWCREIEWGDLCRVVLDFELGSLARFASRGSVLEGSMTTEFDC